MKIYNPQPDGRSGKNGLTDGDFEKFGSYISENDHVTDIYAAIKKPYIGNAPEKMEKN
jgi:hypothetical protein